MKDVELTCIRCPMGCRVTVTEEGGELTARGYTCPRGRQYAIQEVTNPTRTVTSSIRVRGGQRPVCSVKTADEVPKRAIARVLEEIGSVELTAPVAMGQVVIENIADTGVKLVATSSLAAR